MRSNKYDFCFVGLKCYDLLAGADKPRYLGGIEKVLVSLARGLAEEGYRVSFITYDHGQDFKITSGGVDIYKAYNPDKASSKLSAIHPRMTGIWKAMKAGQAKYFIQMGAGTETGVTGLLAKISSIFFAKNYFVYLVASNSDCDTNLPLIVHEKEKYIYKVGLYFADLVISQTGVQRSMLKNSFKYDSIVLQPPMHAPVIEDDHKKDNNKIVRNILWMGRIIEVKRLEMLLDVAEVCSQYEFNIVGTPNDEDEYYRSVTDRARSIKNVNLLGKVPESALPVIFSTADVFCSTSILEGFPTTFLEAWSYGVPVVTTFDPDGIVDREGLGVVVQNSEELAKEISIILNDRNIRNEISAKAKEYFDNNYSVQAVVPRFASVLEHNI